MRKSLEIPSGARSALAAGVAALGIKLYTLGLFYVVSASVPPRSDYDVFLFLREGQGRAERLEEIRASFLERCQRR